MIDIYLPRALLPSKLPLHNPLHDYIVHNTRTRATTDTVIEALEVEGNPPSPVDTAIMKIENKGSFAATRRRPRIQSTKLFTYPPLFWRMG